MGKKLKGLIKGNNSLKFQNFTVGWCFMNNPIFAKNKGNSGSGTCQCSVNCRREL